MLNKFEKNNKKLYETRAEVRTEMDQSMEKIQRLFNTMQEKIDEKWEKNYVEFDCKMVERTEQVDNNSGHIIDNCKDLREVSREEYVLNKIYLFKQLEEELLNKDRIIEVKKFDELVRILEIYYQYGKDGVRNDVNEYYNHYNNYEQRKYSYSGQGKNNHNYSQELYQENQIYHYHKNRNSRSCGRNLNINKIIQKLTKNVDTIEESEDHQDSDDDKEKEKFLYRIYRFYQQKFSIGKEKVSQEKLMVPDMSVEMMNGMNILNQ
ncbi:hypothetical protein FQA39_LY07117 [Lamprigera yunnana]|nr:hypothetical protein FQA39_LY07117 [Lamprigera yunnana]